MSEWRKPRIPASERVQKAIERAREAITSAGDGPEGSVGPFYSGRALRRGGAGQPRHRIFSETMKIPKSKK